MSSVRARVHETSSVQDHLIQRTLSMRGPGLVPPTQLRRQLEAYSEKYETRNSQAENQGNDHEAKQEKRESK
jgi:hypothetical protein